VPRGTLAVWDSRGCRPPAHRPRRVCSAPRRARSRDTSGLPGQLFRQLYGPQAAIIAPIFAARADLVHVHLGEDLAVLPVGAAAARLHPLSLVLTLHTSLRRTLALSDLRSAVLRALLADRGLACRLSEGAFCASYLTPSSASSDNTDRTGDLAGRGLPKEAKRLDG
jgi:hypothetical protein